MRMPSGKVWSAGDGQAVLPPVELLGERCPLLGSRTFVADIAKVAEQVVMDDMPADGSFWTDDDGTEGDGDAKASQLVDDLRRRISCREKSCFFMPEKLSNIPRKQGSPSCEVTRIRATWAVELQLRYGARVLEWVDTAVGLEKQCCVALLPRACPGDAPVLAVIWRGSKSNQDYVNTDLSPFFTPVPWAASAPAAAATADAEEPAPMMPSSSSSPRDGEASSGDASLPATPPRPPPHGFVSHSEWAPHEPFVSHAADRASAVAATGTAASAGAGASACASSSPSSSAPLGSVFFVVTDGRGLRTVCLTRSDADQSLAASRRLCAARLAAEEAEGLARWPSLWLQECGGTIDQFSSLVEASAFAAASPAATAAAAAAGSRLPASASRDNFLPLGGKSSIPCTTKGVWRAYAGDSEREARAQGPRALVRRAVERALAQHPGCRVLVTGHSLGGALAILCAVDLLRTCGAVQRIPTGVSLLAFAAPRLFNLAFQRAASQLQADAQLHPLRINVGGDLIPRLPPRGIGGYPGVLPRLLLHPPPPEMAPSSSMQWPSLKRMSSKQRPPPSPQATQAAQQPPQSPQRPTPPDNLGAVLASFGASVKALFQRGGSADASAPADALASGAADGRPASETERSGSASSAPSLDCSSSAPSLATSLSTRADSASSRPSALTYRDDDLEDDVPYGPLPSPAVDVHAHTSHAIFLSAEATRTRTRTIPRSEPWPLIPPVTPAAASV